MKTMLSILLFVTLRGNTQTFPYAPVPPDYSDTNIIKRLDTVVTWADYIDFLYDAYEPGKGFALKTGRRDTLCHERIIIFFDKYSNVIRIDKYYEDPDRFAHVYFNNNKFYSIEYTDAEGKDVITVTGLTLHRVLKDVTNMPIVWFCRSLFHFPGINMKPE